MIRVAYFGLPLGALLLARDGVTPSWIVLSPTDAPGRRRVAHRLGVPVLDARDMDARALSSSIDAAIAERTPELIVSWYYTRRIEERWLRAARLGGVGAHPSLLPRHRGPNPFFAAIDEGDRVTGVTVHRLTAAYDEGDVLATEELVVGERDAWELARALDRPSLRLLRRVARELAAGGSLPGTPQDEASATWAPEPYGELTRADFGWTTERVLRRVRALSPVPGVAIEIRGVDLFVTRAEATRDYPAALVAGEAAVGERVVIRTGDGGLVVTRATVVDGEDGIVMNGEELAEQLSAP
ncbi:MAG TPA: formyltransferase family protein [Polyangiaceae bacterium]|nr:formyltransferase family protein [Polyangiaceae bacterium]